MVRKKHQVQGVFKWGLKNNTKISVLNNKLPEETEGVLYVHVTSLFEHHLSDVKIFRFFLYKFLIQPPVTRLIGMDFLIVP